MGQWVHRNFEANTRRAAEPPPVRQEELDADADETLH
jgi:hypothetical protein